MTFLSLFAGIGGLDLGLERAEMRCIGQVEIDPYCRAVLAKHWPDVPKFDDVRTFHAGMLNEKPDVICGGFPCQDISNAGKREGIDGERSGLWSEFYRIICEIRPDFVLVENVAALLVPGEDKKGNRYPAPIGRVLGDLAAIGRDAEWDCIPGVAVGTPHERDRVFIISYAPSERFEEAREFRRESKKERFPSGGETLHASNAGEKRAKRFLKGSISRFAEFSWFENVRGAEDLRNRSDIPEPLFRGARDGIPNWVGRVAGCGNAVVPQVAEWIGRRIMEAK